MADVAVLVLVIASLLVVVSLIQPLSVKLRLPHSVLLAVVGVSIGFLAHFLLKTTVTSAFDDVVQPIVELPFRSATFLYVFLPILLFQAALTIDVRRMLDDAVPILVLAVVAVVLATATIGFSLWAMSPVSLVACLLLGAIVATTDPAAVVAIFRDLGAPARLTRLVEGESLLNDAAAITLFTMLLAILVSGGSPSPLEAARTFALSFAGGTALGIAGGRAVVAAMPLLRDLRAAEVTMTLALPYILFVLGERYLGVSGVVAVVAAGLTLSGAGRSRLSPGSWDHLENVWEQLSYWAGSLVFVLASLLVPKLLTSVRALDFLLLAVLVLAALAARAVVLFLLLPALCRVGLSQRIDNAYKVVITWGGLRGAVTLALALAVTENRKLGPEVKQFVAALSTGFVLFTLLVNGTTLRPLIRFLGLDRLPPLHQAIRKQVVALSLVDVVEAVKAAGARHALSAAAVQAVTAPYDERIRQVSDGSIEEALSDRDRLAVGLVALADRERELVLGHHADGTVSPAVVERLVRHASRAADAARSGGRVAYNRAARSLLGYSLGFRGAWFLHRWLGRERPLARHLAYRFEALLVTQMLIGELRQFNAQRLAPLLGERMSEVLSEVLAYREAAVGKALEALRLQYPDYAEALESRFLRQLALRQELAHYRALYQEGVIGEELYDHLRRETLAASRRAAARPHLDLKLRVDDLMRRLDLFDSLDEKQRRRMRKLFRSRFAVPGEAIIRRGERATSVYFISSGAVEVSTVRGKIRLGRGEFFGELALLSGQRRTADVTALTYCHLLMLDRADFRKFLRKFPDLREIVERVAGERNEMEQIRSAPAAEKAAEEGPAAPPAAAAQDAREEGMRNAAV